MAKKAHADKHTSSRNTEITETHFTNVTWVATNLLEDDIASSIKPEKLEEAKMLMGDNIVVVLPEDDQRGDWYRSGWVCFYYYPFDVGFTLPYPKLAMDVFDSLRISLGQLMPFSWRAIACLDAIENKHNVNINVEVIKASYVLKKYNGCRYTITSVNKDDHLILNIDSVNDIGWKGSYLFADKGTLCEGSEKFLEYWSSEEPQFEVNESNTETTGIIEKILALPTKDRLWPNCLNKPIRNSTTIDVSNLTGKGKAIVEAENIAGGKPGKALTKTTAHRTRSKKSTPAAIKMFSSVHSLSSDSARSPKEEKGEKHDKELEMSSSRIYAKEFKPPTIKPMLLSSKDLLAKRARDEKSTETESSKTVIPISPLTNPVSKRLRLGPSTVGGKSDTSLLLVSHGYTVDGHVDSFTHLLDDSLLPQAIEGHSSKSIQQILDYSVGHSFHAFQSLLVARGNAEEKEKQLNALKMEHGGSVERLRVAQEMAANHLKSAKDVQQELDKYAVKVRGMKQKVAEEANKTVTQAVMKTRVEMMLEYHRGEWNSWDVAETVRIYNDAYPDDAFPFDEADGGDNEHESPKDNVPGDD